MGQVAVVMAVVSTVAEVASSLQQAQQQAAEIEYQSAIQAQNLKLQARSAEFEAQRSMLDQRQLESQARDELIAANQEDIARRKELDETLSSIDAIRAARGLTVSSPTGGAITRDIRDSASAELKTNRLNRLVRMDTLKQEATYAGSLANYSTGQSKFYKDQAKYVSAYGKTAAGNAIRSGYVNAGISLLKGASSASFAKGIGGPSTTSLKSGETIKWSSNRYGMKY